MPSLPVYLMDSVMPPDPNLDHPSKPKVIGKGETFFRKVSLLLFCPGHCLAAHSIPSFIYQFIHQQFDSVPHTHTPFYASLGFKRNTIILPISWHLNILPLIFKAALWHPYLPTPSLSAFVGSLCCTCTWDWRQVTSLPTITMGTAAALPGASCIKSSGQCPSF